MDVIGDMIFQSTWTSQVVRHFRCHMGVIRGITFQVSYARPTGYNVLGVTWTSQWVPHFRCHIDVIGDVTFLVSHGRHREYDIVSVTWTSQGVRHFRCPMYVIGGIIFWTAFSWSLITSSLKRICYLISAISCLRYLKDS